MRLLCSGQRRLNETLLVLSVARYSRTGIATIPKLITPRQIKRRDREDDLRPQGNAPVAEEPGEETDEVGKDRRELAREDDPTEGDEDHGCHDPDRDDHKDRDRPPGQIAHAAIARSASV